MRTIIEDIQRRTPELPILVAVLICLGLRCLETTKHEFESGSFLVYFAPAFFLFDFIAFRVHVLYKNAARRQQNKQSAWASLKSSLFYILQWGGSSPEAQDAEVLDAWHKFARLHVGDGDFRSLDDLTTTDDEDETDDDEDGEFVQVGHESEPSSEDDDEHEESADDDGSGDEEIEPVSSEDEDDGPPEKSEDVDEKHTSSTEEEYETINPSG